MTSCKGGGGVSHFVTKGHNCANGGVSKNVQMCAMSSMYGPGCKEFVLVYINYELDYFCLFLVIYLKVIFYKDYLVLGRQSVS